MASITIRNLSAESKARLGDAPNSAVAASKPRCVLDHAAEEASSAGRFPHNLIALVEPGEDIEPFIREHRQTQEPVELT